MSTMTKEWLQQTIAEYEANRDELPFGLDTNSAIELQAFKLALASLEANGAIANEGTITATQFKPVADLYEVTVPSGRSTTFTKDAAEASDCRVMGWSVQEYVKLERYQAAMLQGADGNSPVIPDGWVACSERMPEDTKMVLAFSHGEIVAAYWNYVMCPIEYKKYRAFTYLSGSLLEGVTHWMPMPAAPQQEVKEKL